jgi:hypothetical protein
MEAERYVFGAGPMPNVDSSLYVVFIEPSSSDASMFFVDEPEHAVIGAKSRYPGDRFVVLPPFSTAPDIPVPDAVADVMVADLAELVSPDDFQGVSDANMVRRLCRSAINLSQVRSIDGDQLLIAEITGASISNAEIAVSVSQTNVAGLTLYPGRDAFARMAKWPSDKPFSCDELFALHLRDLPEWAAMAAQAVCGSAVVPKPIHVLGDARVPISNQDAALLIAVMESLAFPTGNSAGDIRVRLQRWTN